MLVLVLVLGTQFVESESGGRAIVFAAERRDEIRAELIERARNDPAIVAAALVGASATSGDRWSDIDLTFGVASGTSLELAMTEWTGHMADQHKAAVLFDIAAGSTIYRVFLLPGSLQVDLSFGPTAEWGSRGPRFHLLFGKAETLPIAVPATTSHLFGYAVHHLVRARVCIERKRLWQAEHWLSEAREIAMTFNCRRLGLDEQYGRGFDQLPSESQDHFAQLLIGKLDPESMETILRSVASFLLAEADALEPGIVDSVIPALAPILTGTP